jgi:pilus assembly protein CpaC
VESLVVVGSVGIEHLVNVRIDFYFVQLNKSSSYLVGLEWPGRIGTGASLAASYDFVANATAARAGIANQPLPILDIATTRGWAKVLKQSTVITVSGTEATFENGGEQNFPVAAGLTGAIHKIPFGTNVTVLPRYDFQTHDLEVKVNADVSDLTAPGAATSLPGRQTAKISTLVHLKLGQAIVLSGIRTRSQTHTVTGLPGLSDIPVLGLLFGGHRDEKSEIEGAVYIVPSIIESTPRSSFDMVATALARYEQYSGDLRGADTYPKEPAPVVPPAPPAFPPRPSIRK